MKKINKVQLKQLVEAALFVADGPMTKLALRESVLAEFTVSERALNEVLKELVLDYQPRGI